MSHEFYRAGSDSRRAWEAGTATCPECRRYGCRGQCGCRCESCKKTPVASWTSGDCDIIRERRACATPEGKAQWLKDYREGVAGVNSKDVTWGECVAQVERAGCPHHVLAVARRPEAKMTSDGAKHWWNVARSGKPTLLLSGTTGTGKTVAAAWCAIKYAEARKWWVGQATGENRIPLVWIPADNLARLSLLRDEDEALIERAGAAEFLVVDELGAMGGKAGLLALAQLIARRVDSGKPLVITTNTSGEELATAFGRHVVDRMRTAHLVKSAEKSMRRAS